MAPKKTAALFWLATRTAAHLVGAGPDVTALATTFGEKLGIGFQILDDILDVTSTEDLLGKKSGIDIRERKPSLVNVLWLQSGSSRARVLASDEPINDETVDECLAELRASPVIGQARDMALRYTDAASQALDEIARIAPRANHEEIANLRTLIEYTLERME